jgi:hypothetical protein
VQSDLLWLAFVHFIASIEPIGFFQLALDHGAVHGRHYVGSLCCVGALRPQALAANHHLVDSPGRREDPRSSGWARDVLFGVVLRLVWVVILEIRLFFGVARFGTAGAEPNPGGHCSFSLFWSRCVTCCAISGPRALLQSLRFSIHSTATIHPAQEKPADVVRLHTGCPQGPLSTVNNWSEVTKSSSAIGQGRIPVLFSIQPGLVQTVLRSSRCWCRFVVWRNRGLPLSS